MSIKSRQREKDRAAAAGKTQPSSVGGFVNDPAMEAAWLADFEPYEGPLSEEQKSVFDGYKKSFGGGGVGMRASKGGALHFYVIHPEFGPVAGPLQ